MGIGNHDVEIDSEDAIRRDFLTGPLTWAEAVRRLIGLGYSQEDADHQIDEWCDAAEAERPSGVDT